MTPRILLFLLTVAVFAPAQGGAFRLGPALHSKVTFTQEVSCNSIDGGGWIKDLEIRSALPADDERQQVTNLVLTPEPERIVEDSFGNRIAIWSRPRVPSGETLSFSWTCEARTAEARYEVDLEALRPLSEAPEDIKARYLGDGRKYRLDDPSIRNAAAKAAEGARNPYDLAFKINEYVRKHLVYKNDGRWDNAVEVLKQGHGSCSEYNFLFVALCRVNGLPARYAGATARRNGDDVYEDTVHHRWSEVYLPGYGWMPVDVSRNDGEDGAPINRWFGAVADRLLVLVKGDGGEREPLGWSYVASVLGEAQDGAEFVRSKRFLWEQPSTSILPETMSGGN